MWEFVYPDFEGEERLKNLVSFKRKKQNFLKKRVHIFDRKKIFIVIQTESYVFIRRTKKSKIQCNKKGMEITVLVASREFDS